MAARTLSVKVIVKTPLKKGLDELIDELTARLKKSEISQEDCNYIVDAMDRNMAQLYTTRQITVPKEKGGPLVALEVGASDTFWTVLSFLKCGHIDSLLTYVKAMDDRRLNQSETT